MRLVFSFKRPQRNFLPVLPGEDTVRRGPSLESTCAGTLISDLQPPKLGEKKIQFSISCPVCGVLLQQPKESEQRQKRQKTGT